MRHIFSASNRQDKARPVICHTKRLRADGEAVTDRQEKIPGFHQEALSHATVVLVGGGGLGGEIGSGLVRKGVGTMVILDHDIVELSNLNRQKFYAEDLYKPKAHCLARNLAREGFGETTILGYNLSFQDALARAIDLTGSLAIVAVDSNACRVAASEYYRKQHIPVLFTAVSEDANHGYAFVQEPDNACFGCLFPQSVNDQTSPCPGTPAILDILKVVAGIVVYAVDSLLMERKRFWSYKDVFLDGSIPGRDWQVARREDCTLCGAQQDEPHGATRL